MSQEPALPRITDEDLEASRATVRALLVGRYEALWRPIAAALAMAEDPAGIPPDPRLLEIGIRVTKELGDLYEVKRHRPIEPTDEEEQGLGPEVDRRAMVEDRLAQIEARIKPTG